MKQIWKKIRKNSMWLLLMLGLCGVGIRIALTNAEPYSPDTHQLLRNPTATMWFSFLMPGMANQLKLSSI